MQLQMKSKAMQNKDYKIGEEIRTWSILIPDLAAKELEKTLKSKWINTGKKEKEFRQKICNRFKVPYATATTSGTTALKIALKSLGIGNGDEVVTTPFTFMATNSAILEVGAKPIFADIQYDTLNIDPLSVSQKITEKTKAIMCVHYAGNPADLDELREIANHHNLPVIEDSAHAMASEYKGNVIGSIGDIACFSFQCVKIVTCGDGGVVTTPNKKIYEKAQKISWYGINRDQKKMNILDPLPHEPDCLGLKGNMNDIVATLGCVAIDYLDTALDFRYTLGTMYREELNNLSKIKLINYKADRTPNYQIFPVHVEDRSEFAEFMWNHGIQVSINNRRNDLYKIFGGIQTDLINVSKADEDVVLIPLHNDLSDSDIDRIISKIQQYDKI